MDTGLVTGQGYTKCRRGGTICLEYRQNLIVWKVCADTLSYSHPCCKHESFSGLECLDPLKRVCLSKMISQFTQDFIADFFPDLAETAEKFAAFLQIEIVSCINPHQEMILTKIGQTELPTRNANLMPMQVILSGFDGSTLEFLLVFLGLCFSTERLLQSDIQHGFIVLRGLPEWTCRRLLYTTFPKSIPWCGKLQGSSILFVRLNQPFLW